MTGMILYQPQALPAVDILARFRVAKTMRQPWENIWNDCADFTLPYRQTGYGGLQKNTKLFDGTASDSVDQLASSLLAQLTPPWSSWIGLVPGPAATDKEIAYLAPLLKETNEILQSHFDRSNFTVEMHQAFLDLVTYGTACLRFDETEPGAMSAFQFHTTPLNSIFPTGGLTRRYGSYYVDTASGNGRLISFEFNADQAYLLVVTDSTLTIYGQGLQVAQLSSPWTAGQIKNLTWTQSADTVLLCHADVPPKKLTRLSDTSWSLDDWRYTKSDTSDASLQPYYKYADDLVTLTPSATTGTITVTASDDVFIAGHVNTYLKITDKNLLITAVLSPTVVTATVIETLSATTATVDWAEQSFSPVHGYPISAAFHQDRLVIGGGRDLPNRLWLSRSGDFWNFDKGTGLDDEGIEFGIFSDQINAICAVFSGRNLQIFTSGAEWIVTGDPLTPTSIQLVRQTRIGSISGRYVPPVDVDGATLFTGKTGRELMEFVYTDLEEAYEANDLALLAQHFVINPVDQCFDPLQRILYMPLADGTAAALTIYRTQDVYAWSRIETSGTILSVATVGNSVYALIERQNNLYFIERFDQDLFVDSALSGEVQNPTALWGGLEHMNNCDVMVIGDGDVIGIKTVIDNQLTLDNPVRSLTVGLPYTQVIEPLPPSVLSLNGAGNAIRLVKVIFRLTETRA